MDALRVFSNDANIAKLATKICAVVSAKVSSQDSVV